MSKRSRAPKVHQVGKRAFERTLCGLVLEAQRPQPLKLAAKPEETTCQLCRQYAEAETRA